MPEQRCFIHIRLPISLDDRVRAFAEEADLSINRVVEKALAAYLDAKLPATPAQRTVKPWGLASPEP